MSDVEELKRMVMTFRVSELVMLLGYAGRNKTGRKQELQARALDLAKSRVTSVVAKIRELYKTIQSQACPTAAMNPTAGGDRSAVYSFPSSMMQSRSAGFNPVYMPEYAPKPNPQPSAGSKVPTHPDVMLKSLPFFDVIGELLKPTSLAPSQVPGKGYNDGTFGFHLTPQQADDIGSNHDGRIGTKLEFPVQIQMRLCLLETSCAQEDHFPPNISVRVNNKSCQLPNPVMSTKPGVEPRRPPKPVNITSLCRISPVQPNTVHITWSMELGRAYCVTICVVRRLTSQNLLNRLKMRGAKNADFTRGLIKEKLSQGIEDEIATTSLKCSLQCPLGKCRMQLPCRATTCQHLQCFDASLYIQMNERKPTWVCPVCDKPALYSSLVIDGYFAEVLKKTDASCMDVTLHQDGSWREVSKGVKEQPKEEEGAVKVQTLEDDSGSDEVKVTEQKEASPEKKKKEPVVVDITSDSDDETPPPPKKRLNSAGAEGKWQSTAVGDTKIKLSLHKPTSSSEVSTSGGGSSSSLAALHSMSMSPGAAGPSFFQSRPPAVNSAPFIDSWPTSFLPSLSPMTSWPTAGPAAGAPLVPPPPPPPAERGQRRPPAQPALVRHADEQPELRFVNAHGYVGLFPLLLELLEPTSAQLGRLLARLDDPHLLWTKHGLRSLAKSSPLYMRKNTEHDPPYWRGPIWININFLAVRALRHYADAPGPHRERAGQLYARLRTNLARNIFSEYRRTGFVWEQYNDKTGWGQGCRPFTGWSALVVLIMAETY